VNNTAGTPLTNVTVTDPMLGGLLNVTDLGIGNNETLYGNYTVTQADIDNNGNGTGFIINNATVDSDQLGPKNATVTTPITSCTIVKTAIGVTGKWNGNVTAAGDIISYQINVNNTAGTPLTNVTVTDPMLGGLLNVTDLGIGNSTTLYGNYTVTREDINSYGNGTGFIINNATVDCDQLGPKNATARVPIKTAASIEGIVTDVAGQGPGGNVTKAGDVITYQVNVTNDGITDLTDATVNATLTNLMRPTSSINNDTVLNPGETWTYTGNYTVTQADINNNGTVEDGSANNTATNGTAEGWPANDSAINGTAGNDLINELIGGLVKSAADSGAAGDGSIKNTVTFNSDQLGPKSQSITVPIKRNSNPIGQNPHYTISKSVINPDPEGDCIVNSPGDEIPYRIVVYNDGNVDLTGVSVNDPMISLTGPTGDDNSDNVLNPGETWVYNGIYKLTLDDINNGDHITNTATVSSDQLSDESSSVSQPIEAKTDLSIQKSITGIDEAGDFIINQPGDVINYQIAVENNGNVDLHNVHVTDSLINDLSGPTGDSDPGVLKPGETWIYKGDYVVTQADIDTNGDGTGFITNTATVSCKEHSSESSSAEVPITTATNTQDNTNGGSDNTSANGSNSNPPTIDVTQTTSSSDGGSSGGSSGTATVVSSDSTDKTGTINVTQPETNNSNVEQSSTPANAEQTPVQKATSTPAKQSTKTPGFEIISGVTALLGAVYLYRRR
jgi:uncharacterized repeat protein (TIGR01451 family)